MWQCRLVTCSKGMALVKAVDSGRGHACVWGQRVHRKSLYLMLNVAVNLKLLLETVKHLSWNAGRATEISTLYGCA